MFASEPTDTELAGALTALWSRVFAYVLSFAVIGIYWHAHWRAFLRLVRVDGRLVAWNLVLLASVAFIPFPTALMGEYGDRPLAVVVYASTLAIAGIVGPLMWRYATNAGLVAQATDERGPGATLRSLVLPVVLLGSLPLLAVAPPIVAELAWFLVIPLQALLSRVR